MKRNAFGTLIKDVLLAVIAWGIGFMVLSSSFGIPTSDAQFMAFYFACIPFGWRWASKIISAVSLQGVAIKLLISLLLGMLAIFLVIGGDVIRCIADVIGSSSEKKRARRYMENC